MGLVFDLVFGPLFLALSLALIKGRLLGRWLLIGAILPNMADELAVDRAINYIVLLLAVAVAAKAG